jgi:hypothetical protein
MITLSLDEKELQALVGLLDAGVKAVGLQGVDAASHLLRKITEAKSAADAEAKAPSNVVPMAAAE